MLHIRFTWTRSFNALSSSVKRIGWVPTPTGTLSKSQPIRCACARHQLFEYFLLTMAQGYHHCHPHGRSGPRLGYESQSEMLHSVTVKVCINVEIFRSPARRTTRVCSSYLLASAPLRCQTSCGCGPRHARAPCKFAHKASKIV